MITQLLKGLLALCVASTLTLAGATGAYAASSQRGTERTATQLSSQQATERAGACTKQWRGLRKAKRAEDRGDQKLYNARTSPCPCSLRNHFASISGTGRGSRFTSNKKV